MKTQGPTATAVLEALRRTNAILGSTHQVTAPNGTTVTVTARKNGLRVSRQVRMVGMDQGRPFDTGWQTQARAMTIADLHDKEAARV